MVLGEQNPVKRIVVWVARAYIELREIIAFLKPFNIVRINMDASVAWFRYLMACEVLEQALRCKDPPITLGASPSLNVADPKRKIHYQYNPIHPKMIEEGACPSFTKASYGDTPNKLKILYELRTLCGN